MNKKNMTIRKEILLNKDTKKKLKELVKKLNGLYPSESQVIRSAIHRLHREKIIKGDTVKFAMIDKLTEQGKLMRFKVKGKKKDNLLVVEIGKEEEMYIPKEMLVRAV